MVKAAATDLSNASEGRLTLTAVSLVRPHLTEANCGELLDAGPPQLAERGKPPCRCLGFHKQPGR